jgi:SAM-dependent methyltransferase
LNRTERDRLAEVYRGYREDPGRRRAWAADNPGNVAIRAEVAGWLERVAGAAIDGERPILDAGCGTGYWLQWLAGRGVAPGRLHGVDVLADRAAAAAERVPGADVTCADVRGLTRDRDDGFGLVLLFTVLSSQATRPAMLETLRAAARLTAPGGVVVVWDVRVALPWRSTKAVPRAVLCQGLGATTEIASATVLPPLARRLGRRTETAYPRLRRLPALRTHWLAWARPDRSVTLTS